MNLQTCSETELKVFYPEINTDKLFIVTHGGVMNEIFGKVRVQNCSLFKFDYVL